MPNILTLPLFVLMGAWFAWDGVRRWRSVERALHELAARRWVVLASRLVRVAVVPACVGLWWLHGLVLIGGLALVFAGHSVASAPGLLLRLPGGSDPGLARARADAAARSARLRGIWDEFEELALRPAGRPKSSAARRRRFESLQAELEQLKTGKTAEVASLLAVQAETWVFPHEWGFDDARREIDLFEAADALWSTGKRHDRNSEAQLLWDLLQAWHSLVIETRAHDDPDPIAERAGLARVEELRQPRTEAFVDAIAELIKIRLGERPEEDAPQVLANLNDAMTELCPSVWVFRGARRD